MTTSQKYTPKSCNIHGLVCFYPRQYRQAVTEFIKDSFDAFRSDDPTDLLYAWLSLYKDVNVIIK